MGKSESFGKKEVRTKQLKKRKDKELRREQKKVSQKRNSFDDMLAWVNENGQICSSPPDLSKREEIRADQIETSIPKGGIVKESILLKGRINNFDISKGYGFITGNHLSESIFFHITDCIDEIKAGYKVEFETEMGAKGLKAVNVKRL